MLSLVTGQDSSIAAAINLIVVWACSYDYVALRIRFYSKLAVWGEITFNSIY